MGLLGGVSVTGFAMAVFMSNAGGAWDNAKKDVYKRQVFAPLEGQWWLVGLIHSQWTI